MNLEILAKRCQITITFVGRVKNVDVVIMSRAETTILLKIRVFKKEY